MRCHTKVKGTLAPLPGPLGVSKGLAAAAYPDYPHVIRMPRFVSNPDRCRSLCAAIHLDGMFDGRPNQDWGDLSVDRASPIQSPDCVLKTSDLLAMLLSSWQSEGT